MRPIDINQVKIGNPERLGAVLCAEGVHFTVAVSKEQDICLVLFDKKSDEVQMIPFPKGSRIGDVASMFIEKLNVNQYEYAYCIDGEVMPDPYAIAIKEKRCALCHAYTEKRSVKSQLECSGQIVPEKEDNQISFEDMIIYKLHVRGFSKMAGKSIKKKGTFSGIEEAIPYFLELGINAIEFMPMYEWEDENNYWGYAPVNYYFAPKTLYADKDPIFECRHMIEKLQASGIVCIMEFYFPKKTNPMLAVDVLKYWKLHYGVNGFHLICDGILQEAIVRTPLFGRTKLFFERVNEQSVYGEKTLSYRNIAEYNYDFMGCGRRFLKGDEGQVFDFIYQMRKNFKKHGVVNYMANHDGFTLLDMVSYNEKHNEANGEDNRDGMPANDVWNCGIEGPTDKAYINAFRLKQMKNAMVYMFLAQGMPLIFQGDEFGNSQGGNNNAYCMDNEIGWVNWKLSKNGKDLLKFVKKLIAFRKAHPVLHRNRLLRLSDDAAYGYPELSYHNDDAWYPKLDHKSRHIGCMYCSLEEETDKFIYVAYNTDWNIQQFALPKLPDGMKWSVAIQTEVPEKSNFIEGEILLDQKYLTVTPRCVVILTAN